MKYLILIMALAVFNCSRPQESKRALYQNGYDDIYITGWKMFGCGRDDFFHTGFTAKSPRGFKVDGVVCSGFFKGSTIRIK